MGRTRTEYTGTSPAGDTGEPAAEEKIEVVAGGSQKVFFPVGGVGFPAYHEKPAGKALDVRVLPLLLALRPLSLDRLILDVENLADTGETAQLGDRACRVFRHKTVELWVDPDRDYMPVRYLQTVKNRKTRDIVIRSGAHADVGWAPVAWNAVKLAPRTGEVLESLVADSVQIQINPELPEGTFDIELRVGTWINKQPSNETSILREDGPRPVLPEEYGLSYEELLASDPPSRGRRLSVIVIALCAAGVAAVGWLVGSLRRRAKA